MKKIGESSPVSVANPFDAPSPRPDIVMLRTRLDAVTARIEEVCATGCQLDFYSNYLNTYDEDGLRRAKDEITALLPYLVKAPQEPPEPGEEPTFVATADVPFVLGAYREGSWNIQRQGKAEIGLHVAKGYAEVCLDLASPKHYSIYNQMIRPGKDKQKKLVSDWLVRSAEPDFDTAREFENASDEQTAGYFSVAPELYAELCDAYIKKMDELDEMKRRIIEIDLLSGRYAHDSAMTVAELRRRIAHGERAVLAGARSQNAVETELAMAREALYEADARRYRLHRLIEQFAFLFLKGRGRARIASDIMNRRDFQSGIVVMENIRCEVAKADTSRGLSYGARVYAIDVGTGERHTAGYHATEPGEYDIPAKDPDYQSFIREYNSIEADSELMDKIIERVNQRYPQLKLFNNVYEDGSFHESFQHWQLYIDANVLDDEAEKAGRAPRELLDEVLDIFREEVEKSRRGL